MSMTKRNGGGPAKQAEADSPACLPDPDEQRRISAEFGLAWPEQSDQLWSPIRDLVIEYRSFREKIPPAGDDRTALHDRIRGLSKALTSAERLLKRRTTFLDHRLGKVLGARLGTLMTDDALRRFSPDYAPPYISIHDLEHLEPDGMDGPDRISVARYKEAVGSRERQDRQEAATEDACEVLRGLLGAVNQPLTAYLQLVQGDTGGTPGRVFRNEAIRRLAAIYEKTFAKPPTTTMGGPFIRFCGAILPAIGINTEGLHGAVIRELRKLRA